MGFRSCSAAAEAVLSIGRGIRSSAAVALLATLALVIVADVDGVAELDAPRYW